MQFLKMTSAEYRAMLNPVGKKNLATGSKYHAQKTTVDGVTYDSKKESKRAQELHYMEKCGAIKDLQEQVRFILQDEYVNNEGKKVRPISYVADFTYTQNGQKVIEDTKSPATRTQVYLLKKKIVMYKYPEYKFIES